MWFEQVMFFLGAIGALGGAVGVVVLRNPFFSVLALVGHLVSLALLFLLLRAEFLAAAQVVVYAGAVMVLYVFVVAYIGGVDEPLGAERTSITRLGPLFAAAVVIEIAIAVVGSGLTALDSQGADVAASFGTPAEIGRLLLERYLVAFEAASLLLLVAAVGAVVLARRRRGLEDFDADDLPERAGKAPLGGAGGPSVPGEDEPTAVPAGTAEGPGDPTVTQSPDHQTQENPRSDPQPVEPVSDAEPVSGGTRT
jgi:NADH:ubiquinone oxidoreductase subunit 6 (subunit J)